MMRWLLVAAMAMAVGCGGEETEAVDAAVVDDDGVMDDGPDDPDAAPDDAGPMVDAGPDAAVDAAPDADPPPVDMATDAAPIDCGDCPGGLICDGATGMCVEGGGCASDDDCLDGRHCDEGACVDDCFEDAACPGTRACDLETGRCPEPDMCFVPEDCDPGRLCLDGACAGACGPDAPCPGNQVCAEDGRCEEGDGCADDADCAGARVCAFGSCIEPCAEDADCPGTRACDPVSGRCPEPLACFAEADCDPGRVCDDGECAAVCEADDDCPGRQQCGAEGRCVEPVACEADDDCRGARLCIDTRCDDPCRENADCPGALVCDVDSGRCGEAPQGCALDGDCIGDRLCVDRICVDPECQENAECDVACVDRLCGEVPVACEGDGACQGDDRCAPVGVCADPRPCVDGADCGGLRPVCLIGRCVACATDLDCAASAFCDAGRCIFFDGCAEDADCPGRRQCADGACVAAPCAGDPFDDRRDVPIVPARTWTGLVVCDGDVDRYRVELAANEGLRVTVRHDPADGDLGLRLTAPGAPELIYAASDGGAGVEVVGLVASPAPQIVDIEIDGRIGFDTPYRMTIDRLEADVCPPDAWEIPFDNDARERATPIGGAPLSIGLCPGDTDWLAADLAAGTELVVTAVSDAVPEVLLIDLLDPAEAVLASARLEERALVLRGVAEETGTHALRLAGAEDAIALDLTFETAAGPGAAAAACAEIVELVAGEPMPLPPTLPVDRFELGCAEGAGAPDHVVQLRLPRAGTVEFVVRPDDRQTTVAVRGECDQPGTEEACVFGADTGPIDLPAGVWSVFVESSGAVPQTIEARVR